jgi:arginase
MMNPICIGYASGIAAENPGCALAATTLQNDFHKIASLDKLKWLPLVHSETKAKRLATTDSVMTMATEIAKEVSDCLHNKKQFVVFGGDHTSAIGTWSGVSSVCSNQFGLIWIDAHMDSHTPQTSESKNLHGMPLAVLLGHGDKRLTDILNYHPKVLPNHVCLIGVRSFEKGEAELLQKLNVRVYFMDEVNQRGFDVVFQEALQYIKKNTPCFGVSLDLDAIAPNDAPGTGARVQGGIAADAVVHSLMNLTKDPNFVGLEIVELDPSLDEQGKTVALVERLVEATFSLDA